MNQSTFELHTCRLPTADGHASPANDPQPVTVSWDDPPSRGEVFRVAADGGPLRLGIDSESGCLAGVAGLEPACVEFRVVQRKLGPALVMLPQRRGVLVNGLPALSMAVLRPQDSVVVSAGEHLLVTERIRPYVGPPTTEMLAAKLKCPLDRLPVTADTRVVTCGHCGLPYHNETEHSHPHTPEAERLDCFSKVKSCLSCGRPLTLEETLAWDPATL